MSVNPVSLVRTKLAAALRGRVAGEDALEVSRQIWTAPGERWFTPEDAIHMIHQDASMFVGGIRSLLLQSLHPLAMAGVAGHSGYRADPWGRLQRTSTYLAVTTFGTQDQAEELIAKIRGIHERVRGKAEDGRPYRASDPHLLRWVHVAEVDSFLAGYSAFGREKLSEERRDDYVRQSSFVAAKLGATDLPQTYAQLQQQLTDFRPELASTNGARDAARFLLLSPPLPLPARPGYGLLAAAAVSTLPVWARAELRLPRIPLADKAIGTGMGAVATSAIRWAMDAPTTGLKGD
ncbi:DUF2236 domain-containing protein [Nakamurella antarctica]|uniref:DUF2236 domain-containing protein n=1 Tax=Nakamurella antarctica TaxID=1902245 RepID=A0A3G8ZKX8_9ACTN|nr:oxygenase MpaB family protein [Nakamurella antarctica]AZI57969.1 DUF2236 domain-containing protein [Nakamurella antarctica]